MCVMSQCKKFVPNIFHKTKCSNCFRQKEEHTAEALECNRASRSIARSGYLFVAPDWDFSVPLNRTKRWQRRWFVLYDDGELNYSVDEHPDTVPQGSVDMSKVLEVTGAEQVTGHPHSLALTSPDRVTFVKAASREDARWWAELLAVFPRRHKRNATFPGGRASPSLPQLGRSASPQPQRPRHLSCNGPSPRTNFTTPPLKEEKEQSPKGEENADGNCVETIVSTTSSIASASISSKVVSTATSPSTITARPTWFPKPTNTVPIESTPRTDYRLISSCSPPTRDKLRCDEKIRSRRDWRHERLRDIATDIITDRSSVTSSLTLPAEGLLNLKKGWLWYKINGEWMKRWWVLCGPTLNGYHDQDEHGIPEITIELSTVIRYFEIETDFKYGFEIEWSGSSLILSAVTYGIRSNWLQALKKVAPCHDILVVPVKITTATTAMTKLPMPTITTAAMTTSTMTMSTTTKTTMSSATTPPVTMLTITTPTMTTSTKTMPSRSLFLSSDEEYRTASEGGRRDSEDWSEIPSSPLPPSLYSHNSIKEKSRIRSRLTKSRHGTIDSVSTDELDTCREPEYEEEEAEIEGEEETKNISMRYQDKKRTRPIRCQSRYSTLDSVSTDELDAYKEPDVKLRNVFNKRKLKIECLTCCRRVNQHLDDRIREMSSSKLIRSKFSPTKRIESIRDLTDVDLDVNLDELTEDELIVQFIDLRDRFLKAIVEIKTVKKELRESYVKYDNLELEMVNLKKNLQIVEDDARSHSVLMANRVQDLTNKLTIAEKQCRSLKVKLQHSRGKRRSLSLKGRENFSINKEVEDKVNELEAKILVLEKSRTRRKRRERSTERLAASSPNRTERPPPPPPPHYHQQQHHQQSRSSTRRKSLDSATTSEPMKLLMRLSNLENKILDVNASNESLSILTSDTATTRTDTTKFDERLSKTFYLSCENKLKECLNYVHLLKDDKHNVKLNALNDKSNDLNDKCNVKLNVVNDNTTNELVINLERLLNDCCSSFSNVRDNSETNAYNMSSNNVVQQLISLLNDKLNDINERKRLLREENNFNEREHMGLLAEKLAYENVLIDRIREALETTIEIGETYCERYVYKEIIETKNLIDNLQNKLSGHVKKEGHLYKTTADYLTKILTNRLMLTNRDGRLKSYNLTPYVDVLLEEQNRLNVNLQAYKSKKLTQLAYALANEALTLSTDTACRLMQTTDEIWKKARETVNNELIRSEINHVLRKAAQIYEADSNRDQNCFFTFYASERVVLELWSESVDDYLRDEIERNVCELTDLFEINLTKLRQRQNWRRSVENERISKSINLLLNEYADVIAHKALIDARLYVLTTEDKRSETICETDDKLFVQKLMHQDLFYHELQLNNLFANDLNLEAEFKLMYDANKKDCIQDVVKIESNKFKQSLLEIAEEIYQLNRMVNGEYMMKAIEDDTDIDKTCKKLRDILYEIRNCLNRSKSYEEEDSLYLGAEYSNQVENLRSAYRRILLECINHKQRTDLEQLQLLCERVLITIEHWHCKMLRDIRDQHVQEIESLRQDKEQALVEETQATLAALDAMRKAHEADVKREVTKFKDDYQRKQQNNWLQLSERLSVKCLEVVALEEQLDSTTRQLVHAQQYILQLERNPQFSSMQQN